MASFISFSVSGISIMGWVTYTKFTTPNVMVTTLLSNDNKISVF